MHLLEIDKMDTYYGESHIIKDLSLIVTEGEIVTLIGRNGAGKTTTLRSIMGLTPPRSGEIKFRAQIINGLQPFELTKMGIGFVFEDRRIFPDLTVRDNLEIALIHRQTGQKQWTIERVFEVFPVLKKLEKSKGMHLSGGEQQMLAIARTLMGNSILLLLDEPCEGLAPLIVKSLGELMEQIKKEMTILLTEQNVKFALNLADRGYLIEKGTIRYEGTTEELRSNREVQERFLGV
jgi:branched-chain amino acid transport system ATP-binding protein